MFCAGVPRRCAVVSKALCIASDPAARTSSKAGVHAFCRIGALLGSTCSVCAKGDVSAAAMGGRITLGTIIASSMPMLQCWYYSPKRLKNTSIHVGALRGLGNDIFSGVASKRRIVEKFDEDCVFT